MIIYQDKIIEIVAIGAVAFSSIFFISFLKKDKDRSFWNFSIQTIFQLCLAFVFGSVIFGGLSIAVLAIKQLFDITLSNNIHVNLAISCFVLFAPIYFLANIPDKIAKHNKEIVVNKFLKIFALYILLPIAAVYVVILYSYLLKIIIEWELPKGWVSWLVSVLAFGGLLIIMLLYPVRQQEKNRFIEIFSRYFGLIILPLLVLMTIGIFRRIGDYGITIPRGYILLLNFWFYGIYLYLFITKSESIKWILISFTTITLFVSIGFWSIAQITRYTLTAEINKYLDYKKISLSDNTFFDAIEQSRKMKIRDKIEYLQSTYGKEKVQPFFHESIQNKSIYNIFSEIGLNTFIDNNSRYFSYYIDASNENWNIKEYNAFVIVTYYDTRDYSDKEINYSYTNGQFIIKIVSDNRVFTIPLKDIIVEYIETENNSLKKERKIFEDDDFTFVIKNFGGYYYKTENDISLNSFEGFLFYNK